MAKQLNPQTVGQKWATNFARSGDSYKAGVMGVTQAPGIAAAAAAQKYADRVQEAVASGRYQRKVQAVPLNTWQQASTTRGVQAFSSGSQKGLPKQVAYFQAAAPVYNDISATAANMPNDGSTSSQAAIVAMAIDKMKQLKQSL